MHEYKTNINAVQAKKSDTAFKQMKPDAASKAQYKQIFPNRPDFTIADVSSNLAKDSIDDLFSRKTATQKQIHNHFDNGFK